MLALALEWRLFGEDVRGYHVVQALVHAAAATLLAALLVARGLAFAAAAVAGAFFLLHPANVEASAWIFQIKTTGALALALGALLLHPRRPAPALVLFALALLTKASAAFALPMAVGLRVRSTATRAAAWRARAGWLVAWIALILVPYAFAELRVLGRMEAAHEPLHPDALGRGAHASSRSRGATWRWPRRASGVAPSHEPPPALSPLDPWWLAGTRRTRRARRADALRLRRRREEAAWWVGAAAAYLPVAQIGMTFLDPMADRYLYFALPGLIGGCAFAARDTWRRRAEALPRPRSRGARRGRRRAGADRALRAGAATRRPRHWRSAVDARDGVRRPLPGRARRRSSSPRSARALRGDAAGDRRARCARRSRAATTASRCWRRRRSTTRCVRDPAFQELLREMAASWVEKQPGARAPDRGGPARARQTPAA